MVPNDAILSFSGSSSWLRSSVKSTDNIQCEVSNYESTKSEVGVRLCFLRSCGSDGRYSSCYSFGCHFSHVPYLCIISTILQHCGNWVQ